MEHSDLNMSVFPCEDSQGCGSGAECLTVKTDQSKQCMCVHTLASPDPKTGDCDLTNTDQAHHSNEGILSHEQVKNIFFPNVTMDTVQNETKSDEFNLFVVLIPTLLCVVLFLVVIACVIRKKKHLKRTGDSKITSTRTGDGVLLLDRMNTISRNPTYFYPNSCVDRTSNVREVMLDELKLRERVGEGAFGQVFKGFLYMPDTEQYVQVAVKVLKEGVTHEAVEDFNREVDIMAAFNHDNILKLMGVVAQGNGDQQPCMIFEFMEHGDLNELLRRTDPHLPLMSGNRNRIPLNKVDLVEFSVQIAQGMAYLASQRFVHRDLATRNCLVDSKMTVKISDFGMSRDIYNSDYYKIGGTRMVPVRWLSPEAVKYGRFTTESDTWAFGVVLWEIFSFGKQPYYGHGNEEVISFLDQGILLQRPDECPSTIYHVMLGCWKRDPRQRLAFDRLVKFLDEYRSLLQQQTAASAVVSGHDGHSSSMTTEHKKDMSLYAVAGHGQLCGEDMDGCYLPFNNGVVDGSVGRGCGDGIGGDGEGFGGCGDGCYAHKSESCENYSNFRNMSKSRSTEGLVDNEMNKGDAMRTIRRGSDTVISIDMRNNAYAGTFEIGNFGHSKIGGHFGKHDHVFVKKNMVKGNDNEKTEDSNCYHLMKTINGDGQNIRGINSLEVFDSRNCENSCNGTCRFEEMNKHSKKCMHTNNNNNINKHTRSHTNIILPFKTLVSSDNFGGRIWKNASPNAYSNSINELNSSKSTNSIHRTNPAIVKEGRPLQSIPTHTSVSSSSHKCLEMKNVNKLHADVKNKYRKISFSAETLLPINTTNCNHEVRGECEDVATSRFDHRYTVTNLVCSKGNAVALPRNLTQTQTSLRIQQEQTSHALPRQFSEQTTSTPSRRLPHEL